MNKEEQDDLALRPASLQAQQCTDNFSDLVVETAKIYKDLTGKDVGIKQLEKTRDKINENNTHKDNKET